MIPCAGISVKLTAQILASFAA
ncbi:Protein of unknown function [Lactobacillus delbrueckii subsp. bulgaricus]|nr:Protein of unknown function [Lactobacillus delbrueckii subsp. bulgaricus]CDR74310.1 Protein of unknown function [Lactobacillus delbrueckii subsp. bulgaricus]CDR79803.1 Protein of unknown function [Lactobacillus delbrueckii subsp. lactis]